jgi:hypothetical protein
MTGYGLVEQDIFVLKTLNFKKYGTYLEIGAGHSSFRSNTYLLETKYLWRGVGIELDVPVSNECNHNRINKCITGDATTLDYELILETMHMPKRIDYLQVDIDPAPNSLLALKKLPLDKYRFTTITFEHDLYAGYKKVKEEQINILTSYGYQLAVENVMAPEGPFEDWWIDPTVDNQ